MGLLVEEMSSSSSTSSTKLKKTQVFGDGQCKHEMVLISSGSFQMEPVAKKEGRHMVIDENAMPRHRVELSRSFYMDKYPVTQALWESVMNCNPSKYSGKNNPIDNVSWFDCLLFCNKLSEREGLEKVY